MTTEQAIALASVMIVGLIGLLSLLGWVVTILMRIQIELARLNAEVVSLKDRFTHFERRSVCKTHANGTIKT